MALPESDRPTREAGDGSLVIDCDSCAVRGLACSDCVVTVLLGPPAAIELDRDEVGALDALAGSGLVPPLRLVTAVNGPDPGIADSS